MALGLLFTTYYDLYVALLHAAIQLAVFLSLLVAGDRILNISKYVLIKARAKLTGRLPQHAWNFKPLPIDYAEYPRVAIQLPMFNERAVCQAIIDCCAELEWPAGRLYIQVLDDSTDKVTRELVDEKVLEWRERGVAIDCVRRTNRQGYKAGAMKEGMEALARSGWQYVAVFDADFKPEPDFLLRTVPYLEGNPEVGYVQTRWVFTNPEESYLTKAQEVSLNYHMRCEQYTHSAMGSFFNFNGTAGVWRLACIETSGGWNSRTTVEDMDLSLRAYIRGWKAIFLEDVTCLNELPASFFAYRKQQHRWTCGPIQLWSRAAPDIWRSSLPLPRKLELILLYFGVRKCLTHFIALGFFCTLVPLSVFTPEVHIPMWVLVHLPVAVTITTAGFTPRGWVYSILYVLFENAMGTVKLWAVVTGLLDLQRAQEWVVTTKLGSSDKRPTGAKMSVPSCKMWLGELGMAAFMLCSGTYGLMTGHHWGISSYVLLQGLVFLGFGFNMVDVGGLLGGRLDDSLFWKTSVKEAAPGCGELIHQRAKTIPVIELTSHEQLPLTRASLASAPGALELDTATKISILSSFKGAGASPLHSGSSSGSRTPDTESLDSDSSPSPPLAMAALHPSCSAPAPSKTLDRWASPNSSLINIYSSGVNAVGRRGYRFVGYNSDRSD